MKTMRRFALMLGLVLATAAVAAQDLNLPTDKIASGEPGTMMNRYWQRLASEAFERWKADYEARTTPDEIAAYQAELRTRFLDAIGGLPERSPLNAQVAGTVERDGYRVEKIIFEIQPKHFVTAILFLPAADRSPPPWPGVLIPCGHAKAAKGHDAYQTMGALLALNGMAAMVFDPIDQGERGQYLGEGGWPKVWGTKAHSMVGIGSTLLGRNMARFEIWDGMAAIDYLQSRPEIDPQRIGCTGNSGGGTQTSYLMALDDRIAAAAPSCYLCGFPALLGTIGPQDAEQNIFGQVAFGMGHADYIMMRAPQPVLMCTATRDFFDIDGAWRTYRAANRLYTRMGFAERVAILENDAEHNYNRLQRQGAARWMSRWLLNKDLPIEEPEIKLLSESEYQCTPAGQVMELPEARSVYDLNIEYEHQLAPQRAEQWKSGDRAALMAEVRKLAGIRPLEELAEPKVEKLDPIERPDCRIERLVISPEEGIALAALLFIPAQPETGRAVIYLHQDGKAADAGPDGPIARLVSEGNHVLAVDLRGTGQTTPAGNEWKEVFTAYLLGRSYVGVRAEDIMACAKYAQSQISGGSPVRLVAVGHVGIPALHAAAASPDLFESVAIEGSLPSWSSVIHGKLTDVPARDIIHGALRVYDLPDLAASLGEKLVSQPAEELQATGPGHAETP